MYTHTHTHLRIIIKDVIMNLKEWGVCRDPYARGNDLNAAFMKEILKAWFWKIILTTVSKSLHMWVSTDTVLWWKLWNSEGGMMSIYFFNLSIMFFFMDFIKSIFFGVKVIIFLMMIHFRVDICWDVSLFLAPVNIVVSYLCFWDTFII